MVYIPSVPPDITEAIPFPVSGSPTGSSGGGGEGEPPPPPNYTQSGFEHDIQIGDLTFLLACSEERPYTRETADKNKQQIDTSTEPGEQTFSQWWTRYQDSWHSGAGITWYEPGSDAGTKYRFAKAYGIDIWDKGSVKLLRKMDLLSASGGSNPVYMQSGVIGASNVIFTQIDGTLSRNTGTINIDYTPPGGKTYLGRVAVCGKKVVVGSADSIGAGDSNNAILTDLWTTSSGAVIDPWWVKGRIIATRGPNIYELSLAGGTLPAATWTHPSTTWAWTAVSEGPTSILAAGKDAGRSYIYSFGLVDDGVTGSTATLGAAVEIASFPPGEEVYSLDTYLATYVAIGTNRGVRIGTISDSGKISYGPLIIETTKPVRGLTARDRFVFCTIEKDIDGSSGAARIDLSNEVEEGRYAWAYDVRTHNDHVPTSIAFLGVSDRVAVATQEDGVYLQDASAYEADGYLETGRIRFATSEGKEFVRARVRSSIPENTQIGVFTVFPDADPVFNFSMGDTFDTNEDISLRSYSYKLPYLALAFSLSSTPTTGAASPVIDNLTLKALPWLETQRLVQIPLMCFDLERDRRGTEVGVRGGALKRLQSLEELEANGSSVTVKDATSGEQFTAVVKQVRFTRTAAPERGKGNFGGIITLTVVML